MHEDAEPTAQDIQTVTALLGTIDPQKEQPQSLLAKITGWMKSNPIIDKVTDLIPQTRMVKAIAAAIDAIELAQGDVNQAALAAGGTAAKLAKGVNIAGKVQTALAPQAAPAPSTAVASAPDELARIKQLANV